MPTAPSWPNFASATSTNDESTTMSIDRSGLRGERTEYLVDDALQGKLVEDRLQFSVDAVLLEATNEHVIDGRARHHAELTRARNGAGKGPSGNSNSHATLDEPRDSRFGNHTGQSHVTDLRYFAG